MRRLLFAMATAVVIVVSASCASRPPPPQDPKLDCVMQCGGGCAAHESEWYPACTMNCERQCAEMAKLVANWDASDAKLGSFVFTPFLRDAGSADSP